MEGLEVNRTLERLEMRDTDITPAQMKRIEKILVRNKTGVYPIEEDNSKEVEQKVTEYEKLEEPS